MHDNDPVRETLRLVEEAQSTISRASQTLSPIDGFANEWDRLGRLHDEIHAEWHELEMRRSVLAREEHERPADRRHLSAKLTAEHHEQQELRHGRLDLAQAGKHLQDAKGALTDIEPEMAQQLSAMLRSLDVMMKTLETRPSNTRE